MTKDELLSLRRREFPKTIRLLEMYPQEKSDVRPSEKSRSALELAATFLGEERMNAAFADGISWQEMAATKIEIPATIAAAAAALREVSEHLNARLESMSDAEFAKEIDFYGLRMSFGEGLFVEFLDHIHHRGQLTVYARLAGGRVPQIFGPSADEPWQAQA